MSIGSQVNECFGHIQAARYEDAAISGSVAFAATARLEFPLEKGDGRRCKQFLAQSQPYILAPFRLRVAGDVIFSYKRLDTTPPKTVSLTLPELFYEVIRCTALHEAKLPENLQFTDAAAIKFGADGSMVLSIGLVHGLILAVVASPRNASERCISDPLLTIFGKEVRINKLWGKRNEIRDLLNI